MSLRDLVIVCAGTFGDVKPFLTVARWLQETGVNVCVITNSIYVPYFTQNCIDVHALDTPDESNKMLSEMRCLDNHSSITTFLRTNIFPKIQSAVILIRELFQTKKIHLVAMGFFGLAEIVATMIGADLTTLFLSPYSLTAHDASVEYIRLYLRSDISRMSMALGLKERLHLSRSGCVHGIALWPDWLEGRYTQIPCIPRVGFPLDHKALFDLPAKTLSFMDRSSSFVVVTGSTSGVSSNADHLSLAINACVHCGVFVLVVDPGSHLISDDCGDTILTTGMMPLGSVLNRAAAVIHHGGIGTIADALAAACPSLIIADTRERHANGRLVEEMNAGRVISFKESSREDVKVALKSLLVNSELRQSCIVLAESIHLSNTQSSVCDKIVAHSKQSGQ
jgi:rhamnosyltransferase subunit B